MDLENQMATTAQAAEPAPAAELAQGPEPDLEQELGRSGVDGVGTSDNGDLRKLVPKVF